MERRKGLEISFINMASYNAQQLLHKAAVLYTRERETFSKAEIVQKLNEVKYLSSQKKVPKLSLRKEILHLENKLEGVFELEKKFLREKQQESSKVTDLKRQITTLKKTLQAANDPHINQKVQKLSHLLGDFLARQGSQQEIAAYQQLASATQEQKKPLDALAVAKIHQFEDRLKGLKHELEVDKRLESHNPLRLEELEVKVKAVEARLRDYYVQYPELLQQKQVREKQEEPLVEVKHTILMGAPPGQVVFSQEPRPQAPVLEVPVSMKAVISEDDLDKELPLPPPPRMKR